MKTPLTYQERKDHALLCRKLFAQAQNRSLEYFADLDNYITDWEHDRQFDTRLVRSTYLELVERAKKNLN